MSPKGKLSLDVAWKETSRRQKPVSEGLGWVSRVRERQEGQDSPPEQDQSLSRGSVLDDSLAWAVLPSGLPASRSAVPGLTPCHVLAELLQIPLDCWYLVLQPLLRILPLHLPFQSGACKD